MNKELERNVNDTWKGLGRLGKLHFVFNTYNMAIYGYWFDLIAIYDGYNDQIIVVSDLYNVGFVNSSRKALMTLFMTFANNNIISDEFTFETLYKGLRGYISNTKKLGLEKNCTISYIHSTNIQKRLNEIIEVNAK